MKSLFVTKTFWTNVLSLVSMIALAFGHPVPFLDNPEAIGMVTAGANIVLRAITKDEVKVIP
jgi:hypothetical protein